MTDEVRLDGVKRTVAESAAPIARFVGHSLAVALGFVLLTFILLIPIGVVKALVYFGIRELSAVLELLEVGLLYGEIAFFVLTLIIGAIELLLVEIIGAMERVQKTWREGAENEHL